MESLKGFTEEICFKENLTRGMDGGEKFRRNENEIAPREGTWKKLQSKQTCI